MHMPRPGTDGRAFRVAVFLLMACCSRSGLDEGGLHEHTWRRAHGVGVQCSMQAPTHRAMRGPTPSRNRAADAVPQPPPLEHTPWAQDVGGPGATVEGYAVAVTRAGTPSSQARSKAPSTSAPGLSRATLSSAHSSRSSTTTEPDSGARRSSAPEAMVAWPRSRRQRGRGRRRGRRLLGGRLRRERRLRRRTLMSAGARDVFVAKLDPDGHYLWSERFGDAQEQTGLAIAIEPTGDVVATGGYFGTINFGGTTLTNTSSTWGAYLVRLWGSGGHVWSETFPNTVSCSFRRSQSIRRATSWRGHFEQSVDFGGGGLTAVGQDDIVVATYDPSGRYLWGKQFGASTASDYATGIRVDPAGNTVVTGYFNLTLDLGAGPMVSTGDATSSWLSSIRRAVPCGASASATPTASVWAAVWRSTTEATRRWPVRCMARRISAEEPSPGAVASPASSTLQGSIRRALHLVCRWCRSVGGIFGRERRGGGLRGQRLRDGGLSCRPARPGWQVARAHGAGGCVPRQGSPPNSPVLGQGRRAQVPRTLHADARLILPRGSGQPDYARRCSDHRAWTLRNDTSRSLALKAAVLAMQMQTLSPP